ncbi:SDR family oxidoreductase [Paraglaciecola hydrolytica]|uniref:NAD-dependent epimerase/dehydratase domain-containing protein n=1 Tax=Paraglaciecola hydrolytica TaxID=1799789 RepID=A0A136A2T8_9ALTE|nr:SDR family oxidoreductase [Paraglaciecola hydrolytica]KXI29546.1 hypothetical protein AX660_05675 [Paraglaciecola hydrolytica]
MQISIVGCGWLGQPLAQQLLKSGHNIVATCRSKAKLQQLQQLGLLVQQFNLGDELNKETMQAVLQSDLLILNVPPGGKHIQADFFIEHMCNLVKQAKFKGTQNLFFISTTAVYGEAQGEIIEQSVCQPTTLSGQAHLQIEQCVLDVFKHNACILRLAGLVGQERHPAKHLAAKTDLANPLQRVNLVHQQDVIEAIKLIMQGQHFGHILHLCANDHPSRQTYYQWACSKLNLVEPTFLPSEEDKTGKQINAQWTCNKLGLELKYPSPYDMLGAYSKE